jgi:hypothetical protein
LAALGLLLVAAGHARPDFIYWCNGGEILRSNLDGTEMTTLLGGLGGGGTNGPFGPVLDFAGGMIWTDPNFDSRNGEIRRANLDGTGMTILVSGLDAPFPPSLDLAGGQMYWTDWRAGLIKRANLDGSGPMTLLKGFNLPSHVALDLAGGKMYWGDSGGDGLWRANLDGSGQEKIVQSAGSGGSVSWTTLDVADGKVYFSNWMTGSADIRRANLDGSGVEVLVHLQNPCAVALDVARGMMYWADSGAGQIGRANLDGTDQEILITRLGPFGIALDLGTPGTAVFYALAAPTSVPSGTAFDLKVTAADPYGNIDVNYQGTVTFSTSDTDPGIALPADYTFTADDRGVHTFPGAVSLSTPGDQTITVTDTASGITRTAKITVVAPN